MKHNKIILLVEDDIEIATRLMSKILALSNIDSVYHTTQIKEAISFLETTTPDLIILDLKLPDGNGMEILKKVKRNSSKIIVFMFSINSELRNICLRNGADKFFDKKEGSDKLLDSLRLL